MQKSTNWAGQLAPAVFSGEKRRGWEKGSRREGKTHLLPVHVQPLQDLLEMNLLDRLLPLLAKRKMPQQNRRLEAKRVHVLARRPVNLAPPRQHGTLRLGLGRRDNVRHAHELQQPLALCIMLARDPHRAPRELLHVLGRARLFGLLEPLVRLLLPREALGQLARLEFGRRAVEHVERLDAVVDHAERAVEHAHQVRGCLARVVRELLAAAAHGDEEAVDAHGAGGMSVR